MRCPPILLALAACLLPVAGAAAQELEVWDGRVVCAEAPAGDGAARCDDPETSPGFVLIEDRTGRRLPFAPADPKAGLFADPRVRSLALRVVGSRRGGDPIEIVHVYSREDGHLHDVYFRCDVCNITASAPGPCWCCRQPFELRHPPAANPHPLAHGRPP